MAKWLESRIRYDARIIEFGATDGRLARFLLKHGWSGYLGVSRRPAAELAAAGAPLTSAHFVPFVHEEQVGRNNADVLVLSGDTARHLWTFEPCAHAQYVLWSPSPAFATVAALGGVLKSLLRRRQTIAGAGWLPLEPGGGRFFVLLRNVQRRQLKPRFISPVTGVAHFAQQLREHGANYVVLRGFEDRPDQERDTRLPILVADEDIAIVDRLTRTVPGLIQCDVYSVHGLPTTNYNYDPLFPPPFAERLLRGAVTEGPLRVPCAEDRFLALVYHVLYHKGERAGLPAARDEPAPPNRTGHDYAATLTRMAAELGVQVEMTLGALDDYLHARGLRPGFDTLARLALTNPWLLRQVTAELDAHSDEARGLCNFYVRRRAMDLGYQDEVTDILRAEGFHVVEELVLDDAQVELVAGLIRGSNWGRGKFPASGGKPAKLIVTFDPAPLPRTERTLRKHPTLENPRIDIAKARIRTQLSERLPPEQQCSMVHSADNSVESLKCLRALMPERVDELVHRVAQLRQRPPAGAAPARTSEPLPV